MEMLLFDASTWYTIYLVVYLLKAMCIFVAVRQYDLQHFSNCMGSVKGKHVGEENEYV